MEPVYAGFCWVFLREKPLELPVCAVLLNQTAYYATVRIADPPRGCAARVKKITRQGNVFMTYAEAKAEAVRRAHEHVNLLSKRLAEAQAHLLCCISLGDTHE